MSRPELFSLLAQLAALTDDLRDLQWADTTPQHVVTATNDRISAINEAAAELRRMHGVKP